MARTIAGFASTPDLDLMGDVVEPTAFSESIAQWRKSDSPLPFLDSHNPFEMSAVVGRLKTAKISDAGLFTTFEVAETPEGERALSLAGDFVDGLSIGYRLLDFEWVRSDSEEAQAGVERIIRKLELVEVSLVSFPANPAARVTAVEKPAKSITPVEIAELEESVRQARSAEHLEQVARLEQRNRLQAQLDQIRRRQDEPRRERIARILARRIA